jgi:hypothetical protein
MTLILLSLRIIYYYYYYCKADSQVNEPNYESTEKISY